MTQRQPEALEAYAKRNAPLSREEVARIIMQIGDALHVGHAAGIVHRDLKPDNVLYDPESHQAPILVTRTLLPR
jgi:serine/threonine-protein kinase